MQELLPYKKISNSSAHRKGAKDILPHVPLQRGRKGEEWEKTSLEGISSPIKS